MRHAPRVVIAIVLLSSLACGKSNTAPSPTPTPTPTLTRVIVIVGSLNFGDVPINTTANAQIEIRNDGTGPMTVTGMTVPGGGAYSASWTSGVIQARSTQTVTIQFRPTEPRSYSGNLTVNGDQTSGTNTQPIQAAGTAPIFERSGTGDNVFELPLYVQKVHVVGKYFANSSNFVVRIGGRLIVNELLGTGWNQTVYDGVLLTGGGGTTAITLSSGVAWTITEVR